MRVTRKSLLLLLMLATLGLTSAPDAFSAMGRGAAALSAKKVDEFGRLSGCDGGARLDNFAFELMNEPAAKGYIVARDPGDKLRGAAHAWGEYFVRYFVEFRGMDESRFVLLDGASAGGEDLLMELWLVPDGAEPPRVKPPGKKEARPFNGKYADLSVFSDTAFYDADGSSAGSFNDGVLYSAYAGVLKKQKDSQGYLVVYSPPGAAPGYWRRAGTREQQKIAGGEVAADRMTVINGGAVAVPVKAKAAEGEEGDVEEETYGRVELWVGPKDKPPVKSVEEDATLSEALLLGGNSFLYEEADAAAWMLNSLSEMMRADKRNIGCIVVYPGDGTGVSTAEVGVERPAPDVFKIAQGWKDELLKKHGFESSRVVLLSGPQEDSAMGRLEVWAVPYGAALPDPFQEEAVGEEESDESESEEPSPPGR